MKRNTHLKALSGLPSWFNVAEVMSRVDQFFDGVVEELKPMAFEFTPTRDADLAAKLRERLREINLQLLTWSNPYIEDTGKAMIKIADKNNRKGGREAVAIKISNLRKRVIDALITLVSIGFSRAAEELVISPDLSASLTATPQQPDGLSPGKRLVTPD